MELVPLAIERAYMTFLFSFAYQMKNRSQLSNVLKNEGYSFFTLNKSPLEIKCDAIKENKKLPRSPKVATRQLAFLP